jgi:hypothetical protein
MKHAFTWWVSEFCYLKVRCLHPVVCTRSGSGFPSNALDENPEPDTKSY